MNKKKDPKKVDLNAHKNESAYSNNRSLLEWLSDDVRRSELYEQLRKRGGLFMFGSRAIRHNSDMELRNDPDAGDPSFGHKPVCLLTCRAHIERALRNDKEFSNSPYQNLGGGTFVLALDDPALRKRQLVVLGSALNVAPESIARLSTFARESAALLSLRGSKFDLAVFAEQAALRFCSALFGFPTKDYSLLESAMRSAYRGLVYQNLGRHFVTDPTILPIAKQEMGRLLERASNLIDEYAGLCSNERPDGVDRMGGDLQSFEPVMRRLAMMPVDLSGEELAVLVVGAMAGIVGNVQASVCIAVRAFFHANVEQKVGRSVCTLQVPYTNPATKDPLWPWIAEALRRNPPVAFLPRRTTMKVTFADGASLPEGTECVLAIGAATCQQSEPLFEADKLQGSDDPLIFGLDWHGAHACIGNHLAKPLISNIVRHVLRLPGLAERLDPEDGSVIGLEKLWGFACLRYPLSYRVDRVRRQQTLNISMRIKSPFAQNADKLRAVIRVGAPRIERALHEARHVHFAWFEFTDNDKCLELHTVYDGDFDAYIQHFALVVGDMFDLLFEFVEDAPPTPVCKFPGEFVALIRRFNAAPAMGYLFSAYPQAEVAQIVRHERGRT